MARTEVRMKTVILSGKRLEVIVPETEAGEEVELIILRSNVKPTCFATAGDYLASLKPILRSSEDWSRIEKELREERDSWERTLTSIT